MTSPSEGVSAHAPIEDGWFAGVNGEAQWITVRGADRANPPLLILSGPGAAFSRLTPFFAPWEAAFTLVQWDQPGAGATFARNGEALLSLDRLAADAETVAEIALARLGATHLIVLGISGGSILGLRLAKARPDLVSAFVGAGQIVHWGRQQALGYRLTVEAARSSGDAAAITALDHIGAPPYAEVADEMVFSQHANAMTAAELAVLAGLDPETKAALANPPPSAGYLPANLVPPDPRERGLKGYLALRDEIAAFDAATLGHTFQVPMLFLQGDRDLYTPTSEVVAYAAAIDAPVAEVINVPGGGHAAVFLRELFLALLKRHVLPRLAASTSKRF